MLIHEAAVLSGTTKKAIEYYCSKGLLKPALSENGYRVFSLEDVDLLKKICLLRTLGVSVEDIRELLQNDNPAAFQRIIDEQTRDLQRRQEQNDLLRELAASQDWNAVQLKTDAAETRQSVMDRLTGAFPGFWGKYLSLHFGQFLQEPVKNKEQENAYHEICEYLDSVQFEIPGELETLFDEINTEVGQDAFNKADEALSEAVEDPEKWLENNKEMIEQYLAFQKTEEYRNSPGAKLRELLEKFNQEQGYYSIFIPAMRRLSPAYNEYLGKLQKADQVFANCYMPSDS